MARRDWRRLESGVGERIREARIAAGRSQRDVAFPGCSYAYLSRLEAGERVPSGHVLEELAIRLGVSRRWLETGEDLIEIALPRDVVELAVGLEAEAKKAWEDGAEDIAPTLTFESSRAQDVVFALTWAAIIAREEVRREALASVPGSE